MDPTHSTPGPSVASISLSCINRKIHFKPNAKITLTLQSLPLNPLLHQFNRILKGIGSSMIGVGEGHHRTGRDKDSDASSVHTATKNSPQRLSISHNNTREVTLLTL